MSVMDDCRRRLSRAAPDARVLGWPLAILACALVWFAAAPARAEACTGSTYTFHRGVGEDGNYWNRSGTWPPVPSSPGGYPGEFSSCDTAIIADSPQELEPYAQQVPSGTMLHELVLDGGPLNSGGPLSVTGHFEWSNWTSQEEVNADGIEVPVTVTGTTTIRGDLPKYINGTGGNVAEQDNNGSLTLDGPTTVEDSGHLVPHSSGEEE